MVTSVAGDSIILGLEHHGYEEGGWVTRNCTGKTSRQALGAHVPQASSPQGSGDTSILRPRHTALLHGSW